MIFPHNGAVEIWRDANNPRKIEIRDWASVVESGLGTIFPVAEFSDLSAITATDVEIDGYIGVTSTGAVYQRVASGGGVDYTGTGGISMSPQPRDGVFHVSHFGPIGDGVADDFSSVRSALDRAEALVTASGAAVTVDADGLKLGIGQQVDMSLSDNVTLQNGHLVAVGAGWAAATDYMLAPVSPDPMRYTKIRDMTIDCANLCGGIHCKNMQDGTIEDVVILHQTSKGIFADEKNGQLRGDRIIVAQYLFGDPGYNLTANRTAIGIHIDCPDTQWSEIIPFYNFKNWHFTGGSCDVNMTHPFNGALTDGTNAINIHIEGARGVNISGLLSDNGIILISGNGEVDEFNHRLEGVCIGSSAGSGNNTTYLQLEASVSDENAQALRADLTCRGLVAGSCVDFTTTGAGTWGPVKGRVDIIDRDGGAVSYGRFVAPDGTAANPGLSWSGESDKNTGLFSDGPNTFAVATEGVGRIEFGNTGMYAYTPNNGNIGTAANYFFGCYFNRMSIREGVAEPGIIPDYASLFVGTDGDLKVKFGDGTVKTIATDTP